MENRKFLTKGRIIIGLLILVMVLPTALLGIRSVLSGDQWLYFHSEGRRGRAVEADTGASVEDVVVVARWDTGHMIDGPHLIMLLFWLNPVCYVGDLLTKNLGSGKIVVTTTDKDGKFDMPAWSAFQPWAYNDYGIEAPSIDIYKPGYKPLYTYEGRWMTDTYKEVSADLKNPPLIKSLTAKDIKEDFATYRMFCLSSLPKNQDWLKLVGLIEKSLSTLPKENREEIEKYFAERKK